MKKWKRFQKWMGDFLSTKFCKNWASYHVKKNVETVTCILLVYGNILAPCDKSPRKWLQKYTI